MNGAHRHFPLLDSTNDTAREWAQQASTPAPHGAVVSADAQTGGRGRRGRQWSSPAGQGVYLSMIWRLPATADDANHVGRLTLVVALAAAHVLEKLGVQGVQTKWPNDVLLNNKKIGGVLCEAKFHGKRLDFLIAGLGLNVNFAAAELPERPLFPATSLLLETGREYSVATVRDSCIAALREEYSRYASGQWNTQRGEFIARCAILGEPVQVREGAAEDAQEYSAVAVGIDHNGFLLVQCEDGLRTLSAGEVSLLPAKPR